MYTIRAHPIISQVITVLQIFGMWHKDEESTFSKIGKKMINSIMLVSLFASLSSGAYLSGDMNESVYLSAATVASALLVVKLGYILSKQHEINEFLNDICVHSIEDVNEFDEINIKLENFAKFGYINVFSMLLAIFLFIILSLPFFSSERRLPLNVGFPLDWKNSIVGYCLAHTFVVAAVIFAMVVTFFTIIYWYVMFNCSIKYQLLGNSLRKLGSKNSAAKNVFDKQETVEDLKKLIESHRNIKEKTASFKACFSNLFLAQIFTSNLCICGSLYGLAFSSENNLIQTVINCVILIYNTFDIFVVMYFGNEIKYHYSQLIYCLFESDWINQLDTVKRNIIILTEVLKQPQDLVILKLYPMNLETFTSIVKLTYSMFNILQKFGKK
ncbi:odorant receptor 94b-like [Bradysia coprophila]|uniref:odorant receptor 94b-like n=1 Tax=Bradysia coprophila TaxID=38358 RepID=UPI00187DB90A|nr:odorant receptor 94b-like [Bradysia coprophila]